MARLVYPLFGLNTILNPVTSAEFNKSEKIIIDELGMHKVNDFREFKSLHTLELVYCWKGLLLPNNVMNLALFCSNSQKSITLPGLLVNLAVKLGSPYGLCLDSCNNLVSVQAKVVFSKIFKKRVPRRLRYLLMPSNKIKEIPRLPTKIQIVNIRTNNVSIVLGNIQRLSVFSRNDFYRVMTNSEGILIHDYRDNNKLYKNKYTPRSIRSKIEL